MNLISTTQIITFIMYTYHAACTHGHWLVEWIILNVVCKLSMHALIWKDKGHAHNIIMNTVIAYSLAVSL